MKLRIGHPYLLERDYQCIAWTVVLALLFTLGVVVWLNLTVTRTRIVSLFDAQVEDLQPSMQQLGISPAPPGMTQNIQIIVVLEGKGWPWVGSWRYKVKSGSSFPGRGEAHPGWNAAVAIGLVCVAPTVFGFLIFRTLLSHRFNLCCRGLCHRCGYDLRGSVGKRSCPECGQTHITYLYGK